MKKLVLFTVLTASLSAQASWFDFFDFTKFGEALLMASDGLNENLEKVRVLQHQKLDLTQQVEAVCNLTVGLNKNVETLNNLFMAYDLDQRTCAPITKVLTLQTTVLNNCNEFYTKEVQINSDLVIGAFAQSVVESREILVKCFPILSEVLPSFPGM